MNTLALTLLAAATLFSGPTTKSQDLIDFKRTYKPGAVNRYTYTMGNKGGMMMTADVEMTVVSIDKDVPTVKYKALKIDVGIPIKEALPEITSTVSPEGMPNKASIRNSQEFFVFLSAAGMVANKKVKVGDEVPVKWKNESGDVTFEGTGKIADLKGKGLIVDWVLKMTPSYTDGGTFKFRTWYGTDDFRMAAAEGSFGIGNNTMSVKVSTLK